MSDPGDEDDGTTHMPWEQAIPVYHSTIDALRALSEAGWQLRYTGDSAIAALRERLGLPPEPR